MPGGAKGKGGTRGNHGPPKGPPSKKSLNRFKREQKAAGMMLYRDDEDAVASTVMSMIDSKPKDVTHLENARPKAQKRTKIEEIEEEPVVNSYDALLQSFQLSSVEEARKAVKKRKRDDNSQKEEQEALKEKKSKKPAVSQLKALLRGEKEHKSTQRGEEDSDMDIKGDSDDEEREESENEMNSDMERSEDDDDAADRKRHEDRVKRIRKAMEEGDGEEQKEEESESIENETLQDSDEEDVYDEHFNTELTEEEVSEIEETPNQWTEVEGQKNFDANVWIDARTPEELPIALSTSEFKVHSKVAFSWNIMFDEILRMTPENTKLKEGELKMTSAQRNLFSLLNSYSDVLYCLRNPMNSLEIMSTYALHVANHITKSNERIRANNATIHGLAAERRKIKAEITAIKRSLDKKRTLNEEKLKTVTEKSAVPLLSNEIPGDEGEKIEVPVDLSKTPKADRIARMKELHTLLKEETEFRDQGFTKPRVLVLLPMKNSALEFVELLIKTMPRGLVSVVENRRKFYGDFFEEVYTSRASRPLEWLATFRGNTEDTFRLGISFRHGKTMKLYSGFYNSDIIVASPLGLRLAVDEKEQGAFDYLSSLELVIVDQSDIMLMQNFEHVEWLFARMSQLPSKPREEIDFSRVRQYFLNRQAKYFRQTVFLSSALNVDLNALFNRQCVNAFGRYKIRPNYSDGSIAKIIAGTASLRQVFFRLSPPSVEEVDDTRFEYFTKQVWEHLSGTNMDGTLIIAPSYFDYLRLQKFFREIVQHSDVNVVAVSEYTKETRGIKYRKHFYTGRAQILLITERYHFYKRIRIRGIKSLIWYAPPLYPQLYSEVANWVEEGGSTLTLYSRYDILNLEGIVGRARADAMVQSERTTHSIAS